MVMHLLNIAPKLIFQYHLDMPPPPPLLDDFKLSFNVPVRNNKVEFNRKNNPHFFIIVNRILSYTIVKIYSTNFIAMLKQILFPISIFY